VGLIAPLFGLLAGTIDLLVVMPSVVRWLVLSFAFTAGLADPRRPWRWALTVGLWVCAVHFLAAPLHIACLEKLPVLVPAFIGAYGGAWARPLVGLRDRHA
jgi:hypothetical protein